MSKDRFCFYSGSAHKDPGFGTGEYLEPFPQAEASNGRRLHRNDYLELGKIMDWRKVLSNFAETPFEWQGKRWNTVEHAFQAEKFRPYSGEKYHEFSLDSQSRLSTSSGLTARKQRKWILLDADQLAEWDARKQDVMKSIWSAKFTQNAQARQVLRRTCPAQLWHRAPRMHEERWVDLEEIRMKLMEQGTE